MISIGEKLFKPVTHARIDLSSFGTKVYFGEITYYPGSGLEKFDVFELSFGEKWGPVTDNQKTKTDI